MIKSLVFGRGFGLYGHAVALSELGCRVHFPLEYKSVVLSRVELKPYLENIVYVAEPEKNVEKFDLVCLARRPNDNVKLLSTLLDNGFSKNIVIEKPLGNSPKSACKLLPIVNKYERWSMPYLFEYCDWFCELYRAASENKYIDIEWLHCQANNPTSWKHSEKSGGGILSFYFVHLIALFKRLKPESPYSIDVSSDCIKLTGDMFAAKFKLSEVSLFKLKVDGCSVYVEPSPFGPIPKRGVRDPRVDVLKIFYNKTVLGSDNPQSISFHEGVIDVWRKSSKDA
ncbi:hypothetical protein [Vibrio bivalvicida]|uniref:Gfo/Idh/MocA-like oxidoreductase N-terminal domain-containing protein n=1 Tax=Vibrio bivalvicida TaxID=1276888 RepID=A0ABV4MGA8_9VIBR